MQQIIIDFKPLFEDVKVPQYGSTGASGFDLVVHNFKTRYRAANNDPDIFPLNSWNKDSVHYIHELTLLPGARALIGCGFSIAVPENYEVQIRSRSGKALKEGIIVLNSPGTIDNDYRGEIGAIILNTSNDTVIIKKGDRIAQGVVCPIYRASFYNVHQLSTTDRGSGGFGSTGK
jgi:dUTP pyrophosphatase